MGYWKFIVPEATTNLLVDTSFALADPDTEWTFAGDGAAVFTRETDYSFFGFSSAQADIGGTYADIYQTTTTTATDYTLSCYVRRTGGGVTTASHTRAYFDDTAADWDSITHVGNGWYYCVYTGTATAAVNGFGVRAAENDLYIDAVQLENKAYATTYCEGRQEGCFWDGAPDTSTSSRSAQSRAGGRVYDFQDDYSLEIVDWMGWGVPPHQLGLDRYAVLPGAQINNIKADINILTLAGQFQGTSLSNLHTLRQALVEELAHDRYPRTAEGWQPVRIRYTGASVWKEAKVFYDSGLEGQSMVRNAYTEQSPIRFLMADPFWYEIGESAQILDVNDSATLRYVAGRLRTTGQWDDLGLTNNPTANGTVYALAYNEHDGRLYVGGDFTGMNAVANRDYIAAYDPNTDTWSTVGAGGAVNGIVYALAIAPNGDVYAGGAFTNVGDANGDYLAYYDISGGAWASVAAQAGGTITAIRALAFDQEGTLYAGGNFTNWNGIAAADYIFSWDGLAYAAVGTGMTNVVYDIAVGLDNTIYASMGGVHAWDGSSWTQYGGGDAGQKALAIHPFSGELYSDGSVIVGYRGTRWTGGEWVQLGDGLGAVAINDLAFGPDGILWAVGHIVNAGGWMSIFRVAQWNGSAWAYMDIKPANTTHAYAVEPCRSDGVVPNYDLYIGFDDSGSGNYAGSTTVTNGGTAVAHPRIVIEATGATPPHLRSLRNETNGDTIYCNYTMLQGETLVIDTRPGQLSVESSMFGYRPDAVLAASDFALGLQPGANNVTAFIGTYATGVAADERTYMIWKTAYRGID